MKKKFLTNDVKSFFVSGEKLDTCSLPRVVDKKIKYIPHVALSYLKNDTGETKHFTPATQEWDNSIYAYNKNYSKLLPTAHINIMKVIRSYFNLILKDSVIKIKRRINKYKRFTVKKIFVGKGELKHTSNKTIITFYVYNIEKKNLITQIKKLLRSLYYPNYRIENFIVTDKKGNKVLSYSRNFTLREFLTLSNQYELYLFTITNMINKLTLYLGIIVEYYSILTKLVEKKVLTEKEKFILFNKKIINISTFKYPDFNLYLKKVKYMYLENLRKLMYLLEFNKAKFQNTFIFELTRLAQKIYNKQVEFNIVNLKKMHLNSDIFTQVVSLKLKNRKNKLYKVLKTSLRKIKISNSLIKDSKLNKDDILANKIRNNRISSLYTHTPFSRENITIDSLNNLLLYFFPTVVNTNQTLKSKTAIMPALHNMPLDIISLDSAKLGVNKKAEKNNKHINGYITLKNYILRYLKHNKIAGVRLEVKGRLTKRFTASRSLFKVKWKGGLKNVDSSFGKLSTIMLRGNVKSNIQYSALSSKNRNGAFGVKGWISNK